MTQKIVPPVAGYTEIYCDFCKELCMWKVNYKQEGVISVKQNKIRTPTVNYDTCDSCFEELNFLIENFIRKDK